MINLDVDTAVTVWVNTVPLIDDTDFKSRETTVAYNATGMDLVWNFTTSAGVITQTAVTPTTAGDYDWSHVGDAMYKIEIPASGGGSINNDTEGYGYFSGVCDGVLPWRGPTYCFRASGLNDLLTDNAYSATRGLAGTALPAAAADAAGGLPISDAGGLDLDAKLAATNEVTAARMGALTDWINGGRLDLLLDAIKAVTDNLPDSGALSSLATAAALATAQTDLDTLTGADGVTLATSQPNYAPNTTTPPTAAAVADAVWDEPKAGHVGAGSFGEEVQAHALSSEVSGLNDLDSTAVQTAAAAALTAYDPPTKAELDAGLAALNDLSGAEILAALGLASGNLDTQLATLLAKLLAYVQLLARKDAGIETDLATELGEINADEGSGAGSYSAQTDSQQAVGDSLFDPATDEVDADVRKINSTTVTGDGTSGTPWGPA